MSTVEANTFQDASGGNTATINDELDAKAHPWPADGDRINFRFRPAVFAEVAPMYNQAGESWGLLDLQRLILTRGRYPFLTWHFGTIFGREVKGYYGFKPINPKADPAFWWRDLKYVQARIEEGALFVQLSTRGVTGAIVAGASLLATLAAFVFGSYILVLKLTGA